MVKLTALIETEPRLGIASMKVEQTSVDGHHDAHTLYPTGMVEQTVRDVVEDSSSLALDDEGDREMLIERLVKALMEG